MTPRRIRIGSARVTSLRRRGPSSAGRARCCCSQVCVLWPLRLALLRGLPQYEVGVGRKPDIARTAGSDPWSSAPIARMLSRLMPGLRDTARSLRASAWPVTPSRWASFGPPPVCPKRAWPRSAAGWAGGGAEAPEHDGSCRAACACKGIWSLAAPCVPGRAPLQALRWIWNPANDWLTGITSSRLMLRCAGRLATHHSVSAMSSAVIGCAPA